MRRVLVACCLVALLVGVGTPVPAAPAKPRLERPVLVDDSTARLVGKLPRGTDRAVLQRRTAAGWKKVQRLRTARERFSVAVPRGAKATRVRVRADGRTSVVRKVPRDPRPRDSCGLRPAKPGGGYWSCTFVDEFDGAELDRTKWRPQTEFHSGVLSGAFACYADDEKYVDVRDGHLRLSVREVEPRPCAHQPSWSTSYVAGSVSTYGLFSQQYGRFEARYKSPAATVPGLQEAFWLWPDTRYSSTADWPASGEIDIAETYSLYPTLVIPFLHYVADLLGTILGTNTAWDCEAARGEWNTYVLTWGPQRLAVEVNGETCLVNTSGDPAFQKRYILAFTQLLGSGANALTPDTPLPATMQVDYVRVWS